MEDKYISFTSDQLAGEESFIRWVLNGTGDEMWTSWIAQHPLLHNTIEEARQIVISLTTSSVDTLSASENKALWNNIHSRITTTEKQPVRRDLKPLWKWGLAAAAALTLMVWFNSITYSDKVFSMAGEKKEIVLPEESTVTLNAGSVLAYKNKSFQESRIIHLDGEAFFNVKPGSTFSVKTDYGTITVLGTSFNIISRPGRFEVTCYTGKVKVEAKNQNGLIITPGEKSIQDQESLQLSKTTFTASANTPEWMAGKFTFENQPLSVVVAELERQYNIKVNLNAELKSMNYTGLFESGDLEKALSLITWPLHLESKIEGKTVTISR